MIVEFKSNLLLVFTVASWVLVLMMEIGLGMIIHKRGQGSASSGEGSYLTTRQTTFCLTCQLSTIFAMMNKEEQNLNYPGSL